MAGRYSVFTCAVCAERARPFARGGSARTCLVTQWGETASSCKSSTRSSRASVRRRKCSHCDGCGRGCDVPCRARYGSRDDGLGGAVEAKVGPVEGLEETGLQSAAYRVGGPERVTRFGLCCCYCCCALTRYFVSVGVSGIVFARFKSLGD